MNYTYDEIEKILDLKKQGASATQISRTLNNGRSWQSIAKLTSDYYVYTHKGVVRSRPLAALFDRYNNQTTQTNGHAKIELDDNAPKIQDRYQKLDQAFTAWQQELVNFVEDEAQRRSEKKVAELKEKYEKELQKMQTVLVEAKESSVIGVLRKHFGN